MWAVFDKTWIHKLKGFLKYMEIYFVVLFIFLEKSLKKNHILPINFSYNALESSEIGYHLVENLVPFNMMSYTWQNMVPLQSYLPNFQKQFFKVAILIKWLPRLSLAKFSRAQYLNLFIIYQSTSEPNLVLLDKSEQ